MNKQAFQKDQLTKASVVIPSLRPEKTLLRLLSSLELQSFDFLQVVIVDQSLNQLSRGIVNDYSGSLKDKIQIIEATPGAAKARNTGLKALKTGWSVVLMPDDDVWLEGDVSECINSAIVGGASAGSGRLRPEYVENGIRINFPDKDTNLTPANIWRSSIEACYFFTPAFVKGAGLYDESLGLGSSSPWQSGEGTDLLLRGLQRGLKVVYVPNYILVEATANVLAEAEGRNRLRKYARGTGRVYARNYSLLGRLGLIVKSVGRVLVQARLGRKAILDNWQILLGRLEGVTGRLISVSARTPRGKQSHSLTSR